MRRAAGGAGGTRLAAGNGGGCGEGRGGYGCGREKRLGGASRTSCAPHGERAPCRVRGRRTGRARLSRQPLPGTAEWGRDPSRGGGGWIRTGAAGAHAARRCRRGRRRAGSGGRHRCQWRRPWPPVAPLTAAAAAAVGGVSSTTLKPGIRVRGVAARPFPLEADGAGAALRPLAMAAVAAVCCDAAAFAVAASGQPASSQVPSSSFTGTERPHHGVKIDDAALDAGQRDCEDRDHLGAATRPPCPAHTWIRKTHRFLSNRSQYPVARLSVPVVSSRFGSLQTLSTREHIFILQKCATEGVKNPTYQTLREACDVGAPCSLGRGSGALVGLFRIQALPTNYENKNLVLHMCTIRVLARRHAV